MGDKLSKDPVSSSDRFSHAQQDTHDARSIEQVQEISGVATPVAALDPSSEEYKQLEKRLVRKIDIRLMPVLVVLYILNYLVRRVMCFKRLETRSSSRSEVVAMTAGGESHPESSKRNEMQCRARFADTFSIVLLSAL